MVCIVHLFDEHHHGNLKLVAYETRRMGSCGNHNSLMFVYMY